VRVVSIVIIRAARSWFQILGVLVSVATLFPVSIATAQETEAPALAATLSIRPLDEEISWRLRARLDRLDLTSLTERSLQASLRLTSSERWERFEVEFGIRETPATPIRYAVAKGVYGLDLVVFALSSFAQDIGSALHWKHSDDGWERADFAEHRFSPSAPQSVFGKLNESRFRVEFHAEDNQRSAALCWEIPFGK
jgi:hypothetical protein